MVEKKVHIAMFGHKRIPSREGGIEIVVGELGTRMVKKGYRVTCYNRKGHHVGDSHLDVVRQKTYEGVEIKEVCALDRKGLAAVSSSVIASLQVAFSRCDIVHIHAEGPAFMCWLPRVFGKKVIVTIHGLDWAREKWGKFASWYIKCGEKNAVRYADEIIVLSRAVQEYFKLQYNRRTILVPNGVTRPEHREVLEIKERWGLSKDSYILFLGRIVPEKGLRYLLEAWGDIKTEKNLVVAGGSSDTEAFLNELKTNAPNNVIFTGFQQGRVLEELFSNAYVYVLPSDLEGLPLSLLEAMSYGNCCLVSSIDECTEVVEDKAVVFEKSSVKDLKEKLQMLIDNPELVLSYKMQVSEFVCSKYSWDDVVDKTLDVYRR